MKTVLKTSILLFVFLIIKSNMFAQSTDLHRKCATVEVNESIFNANPEIQIRYQKTQAFINKYVQEHQGQSAKSIIYIPVVFHVVLNPAQMASFPDIRMQEQIAALNRDFSGQNPHPMGAFPANLKANTNIQFYLAAIDSLGNPTNGIERRDYTGAQWFMNSGIKHYANGGLDAWNSSHYYNIWVGDLGTDFLGYAMLPVIPTGYEYGVVLNYQCTGITGTSAPYDNGTSATHLVAHSFNLSHIWGDAVGCLTDDGCADTPPQDIETYGSPTAPLYDACTSSGNGIMFMNFMDYVDDNTYANFTPDQATKMQACFASGGPLELLTQQSTCTAYAGTDVTFCGLTTSLNATVNVGDYNMHWLPQAGITYNNVNSPSATITASYSGTFNLIWQITNSVGITCADTVNATLYQQPVANAGPDGSICQLSYVMAATPSMGVACWSQVSGPGTSTFTNINSASPFLTVTQAGVYTFQWTETNGGCIDSDTVTITFLSAPTSTFVVNSPVCIGEACTVTYTGNAGPSSTYSWNFSGGIITSGSGQGPYTIIFLSAGVYTISLQISSNGCVSSQTQTVTVLQAGSPNCCIVPTPNAGADTTVCGLLYELQNSTPAQGNVTTWTQLSGPGFSNFIPGLHYIVTVSAPGIYQFQYKEVNGACDSSDVVVINFVMPPTPDAGLDFSVCGKFARICATPSVSGGSWSCPSGGVAYYDAPIDSSSHFNSTYADSASTWIRYASQNDTVTMYWFENNGVCTGYDSVNVYFGSFLPAISLVDPTDSVVCGPEFSLLNAQQPAYGNGYWFDAFQNSIFSPSAIDLNPTVTINNNSFGYHDFYWITMNGSCSDTSDVVRVNFKTNKIEGIAQSSFVTDFSTFKAELYNDISYENIPFSNINLTSSGSFSLWAEPNQNYYLKISKTDPLLFPSIANSYYNSSYNWNNATLLTTTANCDTLNVNVPLENMTPATGGQCRIFGLVRYDGSLAPVANATVYMKYQPNQNPARFELTNQNGYYSINNLPNGNYKLFVDIPGLPQVTNHHIVVNPNDTVFANVNFIVDTTSINKQYGFGIYADTTGFIGVDEILADRYNFVISPNPASDFIKIISNNLDEKAIVTIYNIEGKKMIEETVSTSNNIIYINKLNSGLYTIEIKNDNFVKREKIVKQ